MNIHEINLSFTEQIILTILPLIEIEHWLLYRQKMVPKSKFFFSIYCKSFLFPCSSLYSFIIEKNRYWTWHIQENTIKNTMDNSFSIEFHMLYKIYQHTYHQKCISMEILIWTRFTSADIFFSHCQFDSYVIFLLFSMN